MQSLVSLEHDHPVEEVVVSDVKLTSGSTLGASWRSNNAVGLYRAPLKSRAAAGSTSVVSSVTDLPWDTVNPLMNRFVSATHLVYSALQRESAARQEDAMTDAKFQVDISREYRATFEQQLTYLRSLERAHPDNLSYTSAVQRFLQIQSVWQFFELLFVVTPSSEPCNRAFLSWLADSKPVASGHSDADIYRALQSSVLRGRADAAVSLLSRLDLSSPSAQALHEALKSMPQRGTPSFQSDLVVWQRGIRLNLSRFSPNDRFSKLLLCLVGDLRSLNTAANGVWYDMLAGLVSYVHTAVPNYELHELLGDCGVPESGDLDEDAPLDEQIEIAFIQMNFPKAIRLCGDLDLWLVAHLTDLLHHFGHLNHMSGDDMHDGSIGLSFREFFLTRYGSQLLQSDMLWRTGADYLGSAGGSGLALLGELIRRVPLQSERKLFKVLEVCEAYKLADAAADLHKIYARKCVARGQLGAAAFHYLSADAKGEVNQIVHKLALDFLENKDRAAYCLLIECLADVVTFSHKVAFLPDYLNFHRLYQNREFERAREVFGLLIFNQNTPDVFVVTLLLDAVPLLEASTALFSVSETYEMMTRLELVTMSHRKEELLRGVSEAELDVVRLALVRNLARATLASGAQTE